MESHLFLIESCGGKGCAWTTGTSYQCLRTHCCKFHTYTMAYQACGLHLRPSLSLLFSFPPLPLLLPSLLPSPSSFLLSSPLSLFSSPLLQGALASSEPMLRCAAGEALGRMSQVGGEANLVAQIAQTSFDTLKTTKEAVSRMGHSLVLGCLHRYVGGMGSGQHLQTSVSILHSLTQDTSSPTVQVSAAAKIISSLTFQSGSWYWRKMEEKDFTCDTVKL